MVAWYLPHSSGTTLKILNMKLSASWNFIEVDLEYKLNLLLSCASLITTVSTVIKQTIVRTFYKPSLHPWSGIPYKRFPSHIVFLFSVLWMLVTANISSLLILVPRWWRQHVPPKRWFVQEPRGVTSQKKAFFCTHM
jgi:hypothetical protein